MRNFIIYCFLNLALVILITPFYLSLIKKVKAWLQRRSGPNLFQTYFNLLKLLKKETLYSNNASWITHITPYLNLICILVATLFIPLVFIPQPIAGFGNVILFIYLLALAKFFLALGGLDAGNSFGGMGSSREMSISSIIEPITILVFAALAFVFNSMNFFNIFSKIATTPIFALNPSLLLLGISFFIVLITESARIPIDNPETHLELTMVHEAMILEQSGKNLAMLELASGIKQTLFMAILINIFFPGEIIHNLSIISIILGVILFFFKGCFLAIFIGLFESFLCKLRLFRIPNLILIAFFLSLITIFFEVLK